MHEQPKQSDAADGWPAYCLALIYENVIRAFRSRSRQPRLIFISLGLMRVYGELKKRQQRLILILVALFIIVAAVVGPLSNRYSSAVLTVSSIALIAATVVCMILIGQLGFRCPRCGTFHSIVTMTSPPQYCPKCGEYLSGL